MIESKRQNLNPTKDGNLNFQFSWQTKNSIFCDHNLFENWKTEKNK